MSRLYYSQRFLSLAQILMLALMLVGGMPQSATAQQSNCSSWTPAAGPPPDCLSDGTCACVAANSTLQVVPPSPLPISYNNSNAVTPYPTCEKIVNGNSSDIMVPLKYADEWSSGDAYPHSFLSNLPPNVTLQDCDTYSATNIAYSSCTASCGGGTCSQSLSTWQCQQIDKTTGITSIMLDANGNPDNSACTAAGNTPAATQTYTNNAVCPINGACGNDNNATLASLSGTDSNLCTTGTASGFTGSGPWSWSCNGSNGGSPASCSAAITVAGCPAETVSSLPLAAYSLWKQYGALANPPLYTIAPDQNNPGTGAVQGFWGDWFIPATVSLPASVSDSSGWMDSITNPSYVAPAFTVNGGQQPVYHTPFLFIGWPGYAPQLGTIFCAPPTNDPTAAPIWQFGFMSTI